MFFLLVDMVFFPENCYFRRPSPGAAVFNAVIIAQARSFCNI